MTWRDDDEGAATLRWLAEHVPSAVVDGRVDMHRLAEVLGAARLTAGSRYGLSWEGGASARAEGAPAASLEAAPERSRAFEQTRHALIEGDNLQAMGLLRRAYAGQVKLITIDPPYNADKDFVYRDRFTRPRHHELDGLDQRAHAHAPWLSMMYPRLVLARELLRPDGVLCVSIDDRELAGLLIILDEIFGESNREGIIKWRRRHNQPNDRSKMIARVSEYVVVYARDSEALRAAGTFYGVPLSAERVAAYTNPDDDPRGPWASKPWKTASGQSGSRYTITSPAGVTRDAQWMGSPETFEALCAEGRIYWPRRGKGWPRKKIYLSEREREGQRAHDFWSHEAFGHNQEASAELAALLGERRVFESPKPVRLIQTLCRLTTRGDDLVVDLFAGSGTTAHAVWALNAEDGGQRRALLVQLPEATGREDYPTIADITRARLLSAGDALAAAHEGLDVGFRLFRVTPPVAPARMTLWELALAAGLRLDDTLVVHPSGRFAWTRCGVLLCAQPLDDDELNALCRKRPDRVVCPDTPHWRALSRRARELPWSLVARG